MLDHFESVRIRRHGDWNRTLAVLFSGVFYGFAFLASRNAAQVLFPLVVSHGLAYLALTDFSLRKIHPGVYKGLLPALFVGATALLFGGMEFLLEDSLLEIGSPTKALTTAILLTPLFCHYYFDMFLWKSTHPHAAKVYADAA